MLVVETIARIRREHFIKGKTIKEIARNLRFAFCEIAVSSSKRQRALLLGFKQACVFDGDHRLIGEGLDTPPFAKLTMRIRSTPRFFTAPHPLYWFRAVQ